MASSRRATCRTYNLSLAFGLAIAAVCYVVEWKKSGDPRNYLNGHYYYANQEEIDLISRAVEDWRKAHGSLPRSLRDLKDSSELQDGYPVLFDGKGEVIDGFGNPIAYRIEGNGYELVSYGDDGKPGGVWFDSDLSNRKPYPPESFAPSLAVFYSSEIGVKAAILSILVGACSCACAFLLLREEVPQPGVSGEKQLTTRKQRILSMALRLLALAVVCLFAVGAAMVLGAVHLIHGEYH